MATQPTKPTPAQVARFRELRQLHPDWTRAQVIAEVERPSTSRASAPAVGPTAAIAPEASDVLRVAPPAVQGIDVPGTVDIAGRRLPPPRPWGLVNAALNGYLLGGGDEAVGTAEAFLQGTNASDEMIRQQKARADYLRESPVLGRIAEAAGAVGSVAGPLEVKAGKWLLGQSPTLLRRLLVPTVLGTGTGAVVGALDAPTGRRVEGAVGGGIAGGAAGAALGVLPPAWRGLRNIAGQPSADAAERLALGDMAASGTTMEQLRARARALDPSEPATIGELIAPGPRSPAVQTQRAAYQIPGEGQAAMGRGLGAVEGSTLERVGEAIQGTSGVPRSNVVLRAEEMQTAIDDAAELAYGQALDRRGIVADRGVNAVLNNEFVREVVIPQANRSMKLRGIPPLGKGSPTARQLQVIKGAMDELIDYRGPQQVGGLTRGDQAALRVRRAELNAAMERTIPGYERANQHIAPMIRQRQRFLDGADFASTSADELAANWQRWSQGERDAYRQGAINAELQALEEAGQTLAGMDRSSVVASRLTSTAQRRKWRLLLGRDATQIQQYVERALNRSAANRTILGGSSTVSNLAGVARLGEEAAAASAAGNAARGNLLNAFKDIFESGGNRLRGVSPKTSGQIQRLYNAGIETTPTLAGQPNRAALQEAIDRLGMASFRQSRGMESQAAQTARVAQILAQLIGGKLTEGTYPEAR